MLAHEVLVEKQLIQPPLSMECPKIDIQSLAFDTENLDLSFEKQTENPNIRRKLVTTGLLCYTNVADFSLFFLTSMADLPLPQVKTSPVTMLRLPHVFIILPLKDSFSLISNIWLWFSLNLVNTNFFVEGHNENVTGVSNTSWGIFFLKSTFYFPR